MPSGSDGILPLAIVHFARAFLAIELNEARLIRKLNAVLAEDLGKLLDCDATILVDIEETERVFH